MATINVAQFGADLAAKLMAKGTGIFQGTLVTYYHQTTTGHVPGTPYTRATFVPTTGVNAIVEAPGANDVRKSEPATLHTRRVLVRRVELPGTINVGDRWVEPDGVAYEVQALPWGDPAEATLWLVGERSTTP